MEETLNKTDTEKTLINKKDLEETLNKKDGEETLNKTDTNCRILMVGKILNTFCLFWCMQISKTFLKQFLLKLLQSILI
ncbi:hypothetical protein Avbf_10775 [Armadillidium vulgare]|nr:hypothetical protein Avbf_10775 [Armadillidium vulgare]